ncbi:domain of Kin17 curved DNA-binding protein-domain-containing protein [Phellopilus nigrolimitatus]|nr:domain of Kin17 curved DNA-binding protein-domain-containing protein [Phellopilus nigrolimitatus]
MPRAEVGTAKYLANAMKSKGLQRLRWYCQVCQKQCRDENGFKCHAQSESHLRQMLVVGENAGAHISNYSSEFQSDFVTLLSRRFGTKRVHANRVYQEFIQDKHHSHMNATRWVTLSEFVKHLGRTGVARVDETEKGWFIAWIDSSPKALAKAEASMKKERATTSDEQRERMLIAEQIERAAAEKAEKSESPEAAADKPPSPEEGLKRDEGEKLVLSFSMKTAAASPQSADASAPASTSASTPPASAPSSGLKFNALKAGSANPLKRPNVFKAAAAKSVQAKGKDGDREKEPEKLNGKKRDAPISAAEQLILEEQERKRRRMERDAERLR